MARPARLRRPLYIVAVDGSPLSAKAADRAVEFANRAGAEVRIVTVEDLLRVERELGRGSDTRRLMRGLREAAEALVERERQRARAEGVAVSTAVLTGRDPAHEIVKYAEKEGADLIVVGSRGLTGIKRVLLGSVAEKVVHLAHCPVLVVR